MTKSTSALELCQETVADLAGALRKNNFDVSSVTAGKIEVKKYGQKQTIEVALEKIDDPEASLVCEVRANVGEVFYTSKKGWSKKFVATLDQHMRDPTGKVGF
ncbi:MAG: hypothetical protein ABIH35_00555 [Patescibacteria group bacterium]